MGAVLADLSKAFDCIPPDLLIAKLAPYGFDLKVLALIFTYLKNRKKSVRINKTNSSVGNIIPGVLQGSIVGPILFNLSINNLFYIIEKASIFNFTDDNTLFTFSRPFHERRAIIRTRTNTLTKVFRSVKNPTSE